MSYNYRGNQVFGRVTFGHIVIKEGISPSNNILSVDEIKAGLAVTMSSKGGKKGTFDIVSNPIEEGFIGVLEEMLQYSKDSYKVIKAASNIRMNVRAITGSGIVAKDFLTVTDGRFVKAVEGDLIVACAYTDASPMGDDDVVNVTFEMHAYTLKGADPV